MTLRHYPIATIACILTLVGCLIFLSVTCEMEIPEWRPVLNIREVE